MSREFGGHRHRLGRQARALRQSVAVAWVVFVSVLSAAAAPQTRNVVLVTIDGLRWQEVFGGADESLLNKTDGGVAESALAPLRAEFWAPDATERRHKLMPFLWSQVVPGGQIFGNRARQSQVSVLNAERVSYPGYNELLTGRVDPLIVGNTPRPNPNVTVLEWLQGRPGYDGKVAVCAEWRVFTAILNPGRSRLPVWVTRQHSPPGTATPRLLALEELMADIPPIAPDEHYDAFVYRAALDRFDTLQPRVFLLAFGEPDAWAHQRRYDRYLESIQRCDRFVRQLWEMLQSLPQYRGCTSLLLTPDHGRGVLGSDWTSHGRKIPRAEETWFAAFGPDTPARGERQDVPPLHQAQVAATLAALLGEDFNAAYPEAAPPISEVLPPTRR
jgi:hypothetical protein